MPLFRRLVVALFVTVLLFGVANQAGAQVQVTAPAGIDIYVIAVKPKVRAATVGSSGTANVAADVAPAGTELQVVIERCGEMMTIVLIQRGQTDPDCENPPNTPAGQQPRCNCDPTGIYIVWGRDTAFSVTPSGQVTLGGGQTSSGDGDGGIGLIVDIDVARGSLADVENNCDELEEGIGSGVNVSCTSDGTVAAFSFDVGVTFARFFAVKVGYLNLGEVTIDATASLGSQRFTADGHFGPARGVTFVGAVRVPVGPVVLFGEGGGWRWSAESGSRLEFFVNNQSIEREEFTQDDSGWDPLFGGGIEFWFTPAVGLSAGARVAKLSAESDGFEGDVDESFTVVFVGLKLGWR